MTTSNTKSSTSPATANSAAGKSGMPFGKEDPKRRQKVLIGSIGGVCLVVALALLFIFRPWEHPTPRVTGDPVKLTQFVVTPDFQNLSFEKREIYMKMMHVKKDQIVKAYSDGQLSVDDYQKAMLAAHFGKNLDDMRKYFAKPVGNERVQYLDKEIAKGDAKDEAMKNDANAKEVKKEQDALKDDAVEQAEIATWPPEVQTEYKQYCEVLAERKKLHKAMLEAKTAASNPAASTTRPSPAGT
jgi:hypothetical protein